MSDLLYYRNKDELASIIAQQTHDAERKKRQQEWKEDFEFWAKQVFGEDFEVGSWDELQDRFKEWMRSK